MYIFGFTQKNVLCTLRALAFSSTNVYSIKMHAYRQLYIHLKTKALIQTSKL